MRSIRTALVLLLLLFNFDAYAHRFAPSLLKINEIDVATYHLVWKTPIQTESKVSLMPTWPDTCDAIQTSPVQVEGTGRVSSFQLRCTDLGGDGLVGDVVGVLGLGPNQVSAMVMVSLLDGRHYQKILTAAQSEFVIPSKSSSLEVAGDYTLLGVEHILGGVDHLLFVFGLLLLVGGGARLVWTITAFTVGHSVTLSLVSLGYFDYPVDLVEFAIALSIFFLAVELSRTELGNLFWRNPWWLTGGFGLLHGMGFAGALAESGLPQDNIPLALLFFNIGIEVGQLMFVLIMIGLGYLVQSYIARWQDRLRWVPVYVLGSLSALWCIERGLEILS